jgi:hypothetical protein
MLSDTALKSFRSVAILGTLAAGSAFYALRTLIVPAGSVAYRFVPIGIATLLAVWLAYWAFATASLRVDETGVHFWRLTGWRHWAWSDITEAHLSGTGTVPGIAIYRGRRFVRITRNDYPSLGAVARHIEAHLSPSVIVSTWQGD